MGCHLCDFATEDCKSVTQPVSLLLSHLACFDEGSCYVRQRPMGEGTEGNL